MRLDFSNILLAAADTSETTNLKQDLADLMIKYPFITLRCIIVFGLFIVLLVVITYFKYRSYVHLVTDKDDITGLVKWDRFKEEATEILEKNKDKNYAVIHFDIDRFKTINDLYGLSGGNRILRSISVELKTVLHSEELITRIYADVFCVLIAYRDDQDICARVEEFIRVIRGSSASFTVNGYFGIYKAEEKLAIEMMSDRANLAKQSIKGNTVQYYAFFDKKMREKLLREKNIENSMQAALDAGEFVPYLQPQYSTRTGKIASAEALVRWNDPIRQVVSPGEFIDLFERNKFIIKLDVYIWNQICKLLRKWIDEGKEPIPISLNVSPVHFTNGDLVNEITDVVNAHKLPPNLIELEITESTFVADQENVIQIIDKLHQLGYTIAMDDFGSGYSSLNLLNVLPIDVLKIDKEFLRNTADSEKGKIVVRNVITMAKQLKMTVITEGAETKEEVDFLLRTDCDKIQGYYYSKPLSIIDFENKYYA